jgi:hypothetical protein
MQIYHQIGTRLNSKKMCITQDNENLENLTLQWYLDMYKKPLDEHATEAILKLTEMATANGKKMKKDKKDMKNKKHDSKKGGMKTEG